LARPEQEEEELALIYQAKGIEPAEAAALAKRLMVDKDAALARSRVKSCRSTPRS
jgi:hypothetical protein